MWMFYRRSTSIKINHLHERALTLIYDDYELTFEELLEKDGSFTIHHYNIQALCIELYKVYHNLFLVICLQGTIILIIYARSPILSFQK